MLSKSFMRKLLAEKMGIGITFLFISGIFLLISLTTLSPDNLDLWWAAKVFFAVGVILFLFDN